MWTERYRPERIEEMVGNEETRARLVSWFAGWKRGSKAALLVGPPGTGKTTAVHLLARKFGVNMVELNASDTRTKEALSRKLGNVLASESLFGERSLIFLDEVDGLAGRSDYGAVEFIKEAIKESANAIAMAANNPDSEQVRKLSDSAVVLRFMPPPPREVEMYLRMVAKKEAIKIGEEELRRIVVSAGGDMRYAINALQSGAKGYKEKELTAAQSINSFFEARDPVEGIRALRSYPGQPREKLRDIFAGVMKAEMPPAAKARALSVISEADVILGRILQGKDWRLLRYMDALLTYGLKDAMGSARAQYTQEVLPWPTQLRVWNDSRKVREICSTLGRRLGNGQRATLVQDFPYLMFMCSSTKFRNEIVRSLGLDEQHESFVVKEAGRFKA